MSSLKAIDVIILISGIINSSAQHVCIVCAKIELTPKAFINVDFPDAFAPVIIVYFPMTISLSTESLIKGLYNPFILNTSLFLKSGRQYLSTLLLNEAMLISISISPTYCKTRITASSFPLITLIIWL